MRRQVPSSVTGIRANLKSLYAAPSPQAARLRASHLGTVVRLTPEMMLANIGAAGLVLWIYAPEVPWHLLLWFAALLGVCFFALRSWRATLGRRITSAPPSAAHRSTLHAAALSAVWSYVTVVCFPQATSDQQMVMAVLLTGMIGVGGFVLYPMPLACLAYVAIFTGSALYALWQGGEPAFAGVAGLLVVYSPLVVLGSLTAWHQSTALFDAQSRSLQQEQMVSVLLSDFEQNAGDALWESNQLGQLVHLSPKLHALFNLPPDAHEPHILTVLQEQGTIGAQHLARALAQVQPFKDLRLTLLAGTGERHLTINGKPLLDENGGVSGWRGVVSDVTNEVNTSRQLEKQAHTDSLTGLTNRFWLRASLEQMLARQQALALMAIDLDRFKAVNDQHGHSTGDEVLQQIAQRLSGYLAVQGMVARLGGDEFAVVLSTPEGIEDALSIGRRIVHLLHEPLHLQGRRLSVGGSVGLTISTGNAHTLDELMVQADIALYAAKDAGRGQCVAYTPELGAMNQRRAQIEEGLRHAMHRKELQLYWQPKVDLQSWKIVGAETLMRWQHPTLGWISPGEFIPIAEQSGMITALGSWALLEACRLHASALAGLKVSVNVSSMQLQDESFVTLLQEALAEFQVQPGQMELELTESIFLDHADSAIAMLHRIKNTGVKLAMDDFGTGYSSLSYLRSFPFDTLKIDRAFVIELVEKKDAEAVVRMIVGLAQTLGMRTVCEGVETEAQLSAIRRAGCDEVQGYLVAKPMPLPEFLVFREQWNRGPTRPSLPPAVPA